MAFRCKERDKISNICVTFKNEFNVETYLLSPIQKCHVLSLLN